MRRSSEMPAFPQDHAGDAAAAAAAPPDLADRPQFRAAARQLFRQLRGDLGRRLWRRANFMRSAPGPLSLTYGVVGPDQSIDVVIRWDHRITDAALIARALTRLEQVLNTEISAELRGNRQPAAAKPSPGGRRPDRPGRPNPGIPGRCDPGMRPSRLTGQRFLPRNRLLAGRFRPAMRFATRGPSLQALGAGPVGTGKFPAHRRARLLKTQTYRRGRDDKAQ